MKGSFRSRLHIKLDFFLNFGKVETKKVYLGSPTTFFQFPKKLRCMVLIWNWAGSSKLLTEAIQMVLTLWSKCMLRTAHFQFRRWSTIPKLGWTVCSWNRECWSKLSTEAIQMVLTFSSNWFAEDRPLSLPLVVNRPYNMWISQRRSTLLSSR